MSSPMGLRLVKRGRGGEPTKRYRVTAASGDIGINTPVVEAGSHDRVQPATAASNAPIDGTVVGVYLNTATDLPAYETAPYIASGASGEVHVARALQDAEFAIHAESAAMTSAAPGQYTNLATNAVNTTTGISTARVDDTVFASGSHQLKVLGLVDRPDNDWGDWQPEILVAIHLTNLAQVAS